MNEKISSKMIFPSKVRIFPNCKLAKITANLSAEGYGNYITSKTQGGILEKKKHGNIITTYTISNIEGYDNTAQLTFFDYSVLSVCISEIEQGNNCTTPAIILRGLTGKLVKATQKLSKTNAPLFWAVSKNLYEVVDPKNQIVMF